MNREQELVSSSNMAGPTTCYDMGVCQSKRLMFSTPNKYKTLHMITMSHNGSLHMTIMSMRIKLEAEKVVKKMEENFSLMLKKAKHSAQ